jgi:hypothetical protein
MVETGGSSTERLRPGLMSAWGHKQTTDLTSRSRVCPLRAESGHPRFMPGREPASTPSGAGQELLRTSGRISNGARISSSNSPSHPSENEHLVEQSTMYLLVLFEPPARRSTSVHYSAAPKRPVKQRLVTRRHRAAVRNCN